MKLLRPVLLAVIFAGAFYYFTTYRSGRMHPTSWFGRPSKLEITEAAPGEPGQPEVRPAGWGRPARPPHARLDRRDPKYTGLREDRRQIRESVRVRLFGFPTTPSLRS